MPEADVLIDSVVLTLYCSKEVGSGSFGACTKVRLPVPEIFTVTVAPRWRDPFEGIGCHRIAHSAAEAGRSTCRKRFHLDRGPLALHCARNVEHLAAAPEGIGMAALHHDLRHDGHVHGRS